jgi:hypothetical protein
VRYLQTECRRPPHRTKRADREKQRS